MPGGGDAGADGGAVRGVGSALAQHLAGQLRHLDLEVDAVEDRRGDAVAMALLLLGRALAVVAQVAVVALRAGVHRGDELEVGREFRLPRRPRDGDRARLQRFAQHLQHALFEFGELVEEEDAVRGKGDLSGPRNRAPVVSTKPCYTQI